MGIQYSILKTMGSPNRSLLRQVHISARIHICTTIGNSKVQMVSFGNASISHSSNLLTGTYNLSGRNTICIQVHIDRSKAILMIYLHIISCGTAETCNRNNARAGCTHRGSPGCSQINSLMIGRGTGSRCLSWPKRTCQTNVIHRNQPLCTAGILNCGMVV